MERSVVYFTDMRATPERNILQKFRALIERAGIAGRSAGGAFPEDPDHHVDERYARARRRTTQMDGAAAGGGRGDGSR